MKRSYSVFLPLLLVIAPLFLLVSEACAAPQETQRIVLEDGVRLILNPDSHVGEVTLSVFVRQETPVSAAETAVRDMVASALFYGSLNRTFEDVAESVQKIGGSLSTRIAPEYSVFTSLTSNAQVREAIYLFCEALKNADFTPKALERARQTILSDRTQQGEIDFETAYQSLCDRMNGFTLPDAVQLRHVTQEQALLYFHRAYIPSHIVIVVAGDFDPEQVKKSFENNLFGFDRVASPHPIASFHSPSFEGQQPLTFPQRGTAAYALVGTPAPGVTSPDYPAFTVLATLLGGGHASRLF